MKRILIRTLDNEGFWNIESAQVTNENSIIPRIENIKKWLRVFVKQGVIKAFKIEIGEN